MRQASARKVGGKIFLLEAVDAKKRRKKNESEVIVYVLCVVECDVTDACKATLTKANHGGQQ